MTAQQARRWLILTLVLGHFACVLLVIVATWFILGTTGALTIPNQIPWTSIVWAQMALLGLYLGLGRQHFPLRLAGLVAGISMTICCTLFAWYLLTGPPPNLAKWLATWFLQEATLYIPEGMCVAAIIMTTRPFFGAISRAENGEHHGGQFSLRDLVGFMTLSAVVAGLLRFTYALEYADFTAYFKHFPLIVGGRAAGLVGCAILMLGQSRRWIGLPLLALAIVGEYVAWPPRDMVHWLALAYRWSVVLISLAMVRAADYRLSGGWLCAKSSRCPVGEVPR